MQNPSQKTRKIACKKQARPIQRKRPWMTKQECVTTTAFISSPSSSVFPLLRLRTRLHLRAPFSCTAFTNSWGIPTLDRQKKIVRLTISPPLAPLIPVFNAHASIIYSKVSFHVSCVDETNPFGCSLYVCLGGRGRKYGRYVF